MVNVANRTDVNVRFSPLKFFFCHFLSAFCLTL